MYTLPMRKFTSPIWRVLSLIGLATSVFLLTLFNFSMRTTENKKLGESGPVFRGQFSMNVALADAPTGGGGYAESYSESGESACESSSGEGSGEC